MSIAGYLKSGEPNPFTGNPADTLNSEVLEVLSHAIEINPLLGDTLAHIASVQSSYSTFVSSLFEQNIDQPNHSEAISALEIFALDVSTIGHIATYLDLVQALENILVDYPEMDVVSRENTLKTIALLKHARFEFERYLFDLTGTDRVSPLASCMDSYWNNCMDDWAASLSGPFDAVFQVLDGQILIASGDCLYNAYNHCRESLSK